MHRLAHKLLALAVIFTTIFISTALPIKVSVWFQNRGKKGRAILSGIMCFGGGVFLGTFLLHMTPEVEELFDSSIKDVNYPVGYLVIGGGFFFMMLMERGALELQKWRDNRANVKEPVMQGSSDVYSTIPKDQQQVAVIAIHTITPVIEAGTGSASNGDLTIGADSKMPGVAEKETVRTSPAQNSYMAHSCHEDHHYSSPTLVIEAGSSSDFNGPTTIGFDPNMAVVDNMDAVGNSPMHENEYLAHSYHEGHSHSQPDEAGHSHVQGSASRSLVLLLALSIDSLFEGLSLGLQLSVAGVWRMVLAILSHEIAVAFSLGLQLKKHNTTKRTLFMAFCYGLMSPIGISIGIAVIEGANTSMNIDLVHGILLGITAGVFLYVAFFEILLHEITHESSITNLVAVFVGFMVMAALLAVHNQVEGGTNDPTPTAGPPGNGTALTGWIGWLVHGY